jgi:hypothetical protein
VRVCLFCPNRAGALEDIWPLWVIKSVGADPVSPTEFWNVAENSMRPVATGRKNWIHIGSPQAGPRVAAILSVIESCRRLPIPVRKYLADILPGLADTSIQNVTGLTPKSLGGQDALLKISLIPLAPLSTVYLAG